jgi:hypothetical protein
LHAPEALADDAETQALEACEDVEDLQDGAPGDEGVDVAVLHLDAAEADLAEVGQGGAAQGGGAGQLPKTEVEAGEGVDAEDY